MLLKQQPEVCLGFCWVVVGFLVPIAAAAVVIYHYLYYDHVRITSTAAVVATATATATTKGTRTLGTYRVLDR